MANHESALKKHRRDQKLRMINRMNRTKMKNKIKLLRKYTAANDVDNAKKIFPEVISVIDKTCTKGTIHTRTGSRYKSRLYSLIKKAGIQI